MRINPDVETKWRDAFGEIHIPETSHCPSQIKPICEKILSMYRGLDGKTCPTNYNTMSELDKIIFCDFWEFYDNLDSVLTGSKPFHKWFMEEATESEFLRRSRQWLIEHRAIFPKQEVSDHAYQASENFRHNVKR